MPTNILRDRPAREPRRPPRAPAAPRDVVITAGRVSLRARLLDTPTADRLWAALPLYSTVETWGESIHFELPVKSGRERGARVNARIGEIYFWADDDRVIIAFGPTPISRTGEIRLPCPCNPLASTEDDVAALAAVTPGEKASIRAAHD